jgi:RNA polymerase sigma-70 factor (ECF subfamily)
VLDRTRAKLAQPYKDDTLDDEQLIAAAKQGDLDAFNQLLIRYQSLAYYVAYRILGDASASADATQDAFLHAYQALGQCRASSLKSWLMRIVVNSCYDQLRAWRRQPTASLEASYAQADTAELPSVDQDETPQAYVERGELRRALEVGLRTLPLEQRLALTLCDIAGMNYQEVAGVTRCRIGTVKSRISRARTKLRDYLLTCQELLPAKYHSDTQLAHKEVA